MGIRLPTLNAILNATSALLLLTGYFFIKRGRMDLHRIAMSAAFITSTLFLVSYIYYHVHAGSKHFTGTGWVRPVYFSILISHTILAVVIVPLILTTLFRALRGQYARHRALARWTWPLWMYVSVTGVVVYLMLYQWYV